MSFKWHKNKFQFSLFLNFFFLLSILYFFVFSSFNIKVLNVQRTVYTSFVLSQNVISSLSACMLRCAVMQILKKNLQNDSIWMEWNETISRNTHNTEMAVCVSVCVLDSEEIFRRLQVKKHPTQRHTHTHLNLQRHWSEQKRRRNISGMNTFILAYTHTLFSGWIKLAFYFRFFCFLFSCHGPHWHFGPSLKRIFALCAAVAFIFSL